MPFMHPKQSTSTKKRQNAKKQKKTSKTITKTRSQIHTNSHNFINKHSSQSTQTQDSLHQTQHATFITSPSLESNNDIIPATPFAPTEATPLTPSTPQVITITTRQLKPQKHSSFVSKRHLTTKIQPKNAITSTVPVITVAEQDELNSTNHSNYSYLNNMEVMSHSPQIHQNSKRNFQTRYNTVPSANPRELTSYNTKPAGSTDSQSSFPSPGQPVQGVYTSSHYQLTRETLVNYLTRKNLTFKHSGDKTIVMECPLCPKPTYGKPDNLWKLCIFDNGAFVCLRCQTKGSWFDFKSKLGDLPNITNMSNKPIYQRHQAIESGAIGLDDNVDDQMKYIKEQQEEYKQLSQVECQKMVDDLDQSPLILDWFENTRKIRRETLLKFKVGSTKQKFPELNPTTHQVEWKEYECMTFPWTDRKSATDESDVVYQRVKVRNHLEKKNMRLLPKGGSWGFFGWHTIPIQAKQIIITEGELDAMSVAQTTGLPVISLPNGANSLPPALLPSLERFEKIVLWLDDDQAGHAAVESMTQKLGVGRTYHIPGGYGAKDANEALQKGLNIGAILDTATRQQHKQLSTFPSFRHEVKRMFFDPNTQVGVQFPNMPILQSLIKGHRRGELTILTGGTGVGKTTLLTQMSLELASQGVNTLWGSFEIRNPRLVKTLMKQYAAVLGVVLNEQHPEAFDYIADKFEDLPFNFLKFYGSSPVQEVIEAMEYATYVHDVQHIILDNLQFMLSGQGRGGGDKFELQDRAIEAFRQFASQRNVHVTLVIHPRKEQDNSSLGLASVFGSAKATQEADNVMIIQGGLPRTVLRNIQLPDSEGKKASTQLRQSGGVGDLAQHGGFDDPIIGEIMGTFFRTIEIRKNRWDGDLGAVPLRFDKSSSRFYELTSDDISLGLGEFIAKQKKLKQLDLIKHMNQLPGSAGLSQPTRSGFDNMSQNHQSQPQTPGDKWKAKAQAQRALAEHFSSGNLNNEAQQEIRQQYSDQKLQSAMNNGLGLSSQQEEELQRQFDQMYGLSKPLGQTSDGDGDDDDESNTPQRPSGISYGSPEAMAIRNMETKMLNDMEKSFADSSVSSGNFQNHPQFQQLQQKQQQFKSNAGGKKDDASKFKKHAAPVGYTPTLDIVFE